MNRPLLVAVVFTLAVILPLTTYAQAPDVGGGRCVANCGSAPGPSSSAYNYAAAAAAAEAERQRQEAERQRKEAERKLREAELKRQEEERQRREAEAARLRKEEFERKKAQVLTDMKGISDAPGLKADTVDNYGLKGIDDTGTQGKGAFAQVEAHGQIYFLTSDGRKMTGQEANRIPLEEGGTVITGGDGHVKMTLPDGTTFRVGPNSELMIDQFVYDPANDSETIMARLSKGVFRWVTGKAARKDPATMKVTLPAGYLGIRGTDFEATVAPDKSSRLKLYEGEIEYTNRGTGARIVLTAGHSLQIASDGSFGKPAPLPLSQKEPAIP